MRLLGILLIFTSCANTNVNDLFKINTESDPRKTLTTDEIFLNYVADFEIDYAHYLDSEINTHNIPINFSNELDKKYLGACYKYGRKEQWKEIKINKELWEGLDIPQRKALIYHELGHCALNREHKDEYHRSFPVSIMNTYHIAGNYEEFPEEYNYELFTHDENELKEKIDATLK
jgi:hypothetical protein